MSPSIVPISELAHRSIDFSFSPFTLVREGVPSRIYAPRDARYGHAQSCTISPAALLLEEAMERK